MFIVHHRDAVSWWPKYIKKIRIQIFLQNTQTYVKFGGGQAHLMMERVIILMHVFKMRMILET